MDLATNMIKLAAVGFDLDWPLCYDWNVWESSRNILYIGSSSRNCGGAGRVFVGATRWVARIRARQRLDPTDYKGRWFV